MPLQRTLQPLRHAAICSFLSQWHDTRRATGNRWGETCHWLSEPEPEKHDALPLHGNRQKSRTEPVPAAQPGPRFALAPCADRMPLQRTLQPLRCAAVCSFLSQWHDTRRATGNRWGETCHWLNEPEPQIHDALPLHGNRSNKRERSQCPPSNREPRFALAPCADRMPLQRTLQPLRHAAICSFLSQWHDTRRATGNRWGETCHWPSEPEPESTMHYHCTETAKKPRTEPVPAEPPETPVRTGSVR